MTFEELKDAIRNSIALGKHLVNEFCESVEEVEDFDIRIVTLYLMDTPEIEGRYSNKDEMIVIHSYFEGEHQVAKPDPDGGYTVEDMVDILAKVLYDLMELWGDDASIEWLGD